MWQVGGTRGGSVESLNGRRVASSALPATQKLHNLVCERAALNGVFAIGSDEEGLVEGLEERA